MPNAHIESAPFWAFFPFRLRLTEKALEVNVNFYLRSFRQKKNEQDGKREDDRQ